MVKLFLERSESGGTKWGIVKREQRAEVNISGGEQVKEKIKLLKRLREPILLLIRTCGCTKVLDLLKTYKSSSIFLAPIKEVYSGNILQFNLK